MHVDRYHFASLLSVFGIPESREHGARVGKSQDSLNREQQRSGEHHGDRQGSSGENDGEDTPRSGIAPAPRSDRMLDITV